MPSPARPLAFLKVAVVCAAALLILVSLLPHSTYVRFQQVSRESVHYRRVKWIYERIHFDRTPIDIAFIGTSHTQSGVNSDIVESSLAKLGDPQHVVNFAVPHLGRDLEYLVARELLENRNVKTLVIEVQDLEARAPHPGFQRLATPADLVDAPLFINSGLVDNFARLPMRQLELFAETVFPNWFGVDRVFTAAAYEGPHFDDTYMLHGINIPRTAVHSRAYFEKDIKLIRSDLVQKRAQKRYTDIKFLGDNLLYRYNHLYLNKILEMARIRSVQVVFLYLPFVEADRTPEYRQWMVQRGEVLVPDAVIRDASLWQNADHLNYYGARALSTWLANNLHRTDRPR